MVWTFSETHHLCLCFRSIFMQWLFKLSFKMIYLEKSCFNSFKVSHTGNLAHPLDCLRPPSHWTMTLDLHNLSERGWTTAHLETRLQCGCSQDVAALMVLTKYVFLARARSPEKLSSHIYAPILALLSFSFCVRMHQDARRSRHAGTLISTTGVTFVSYVLFSVTIA